MYSNYANKNKFLKKNISMTHQNNTVLKILPGIINLLPDATFVIDHEKKIIIWNKAIEELTGFSAKDMIGKGNYEYSIPFYNHRRPMLVDVIMSQVKRATSEITGPAEGFIIKEKIVEFKGKKVFFWAKASLIFDDQGSIIGGIETIRDITEHKKVEKALAQSEEKFRSLVENANEIIYTLSLDGIFKFVSPNWINQLGHPVSEVIGQHYEQFVHPDDLPKCNHILSTVLMLNKPHRGIDYRVKHKDGSWRWHTSSVSLQQDQFQRPLNYIGVASDITERRKAEQELRESEQRWQFALEGSEAGGWEINLLTNEITISDKCKELLGFNETDMQVSFQRFSSLIYPADIYELINRYKKHIEGQTPIFSIEFRLKNENENYKWFLIRGKVLNWTDDGKPLKMFGTLFDINEKKLVENRLKYLSFHDTLTGLYNRTYFEQEMAKFNLNDLNKTGIIILDVDGLKFINDSFGHDVGDLLLKETANVIKSCFSEEHTIARIGGDEFAVLLRDCDHEGIYKSVNAIKIAVAKHNENNLELPLSLSIGYELSTENAQNLIETFI